MTAASRIFRIATDPWIAFFALVTAAWAILIVGAASLAGHGTPSDLGPGIASISQLLNGIGRHIPPHAPHLHSNLTVIVAMWSLMSAAMMAPTAVPVLRAYRHIVEGSAGRIPRADFFAFVAGYAAVWGLFSVLAGGAQHALASAGLVTDAGISAAPWLTAGLLALAGAYQFSGLKHACLSRCRSPMAFFLSHWREGFRGALAMGLRHGAICVGCCWALMALAFVGGSMNLAWMGGAMVLMMVEKLPLGRRLTAPLGVVLLSAAAMVAARALTPL